MFEVEDPSILDGHEPLPLACKAGTVALFSLSTVHRSEPNRSDAIRWTLQTRWYPSGSRCCTTSTGPAWSGSEASRRLAAQAPVRRRRRQAARPAITGTSSGPRPQEGAGLPGESSSWRR